MSKPLKPRRGTTAEQNAFVGEAYEITYDTDKNTLVCRDGLTVGGFPLAKEGDVFSLRGRMSLVEAPKAIGTTTFRPLTDRFADIINVKDFGAKGDGVTDDTVAIQAALDAGVNGKIIFPKGTYKITSTLTTSHSYLDFGESKIVWGADNTDHDFSSHYTDEGVTDAMKSEIDLYGGIYYGTVMLDVVHATRGGYGARCVIEGGVFVGNMVADCAIRVHAYHSLIHGVRICDVYQAGIALAPHKVNGTLNSSQVMISDCTLVQYNDPAQSCNTHTIGIFVQDLDNHIDNCNICWFGNGICLRSSGNVITNTHITEEARNKVDPANAGTTLADRKYMIDGNGNFLTEHPESVNVLIHPCDDSKSGVNVLSNMYFNAGKYVIYSKQAYEGDPGRFNTDIYNSMYLLKSQRYIKGQETFDTFLFGGENAGHLHVQGFNAYSPMPNVFRDYFPSTRLNMMHFTNSIQIMNHGEMNNSDLIAANNWHNKGATHCVVHPDYTIPKGTYARIGTIMCKLSTDEPETGEADPTLVTGPISMQFSNRGYWTASRTLNYQNHKWTVTERDGSIGSVSESVELFIDNYKRYVEINGLDYVCFDLYLCSETSKLSSGMYLQLDDIANLFKIYIYAQPNNNCKDVAASKPSNITQLLQIGV